MKYSKACHIIFTFTICSHKQNKCWRNLSTRQYAKQRLLVLYLSQTKGVSLMLTFVFSCTLSWVTFKSNICILPSSIAMVLYTDYDIWRNSSNNNVPYLFPTWTHNSTTQCFFSFWSSWFFFFKEIPHLILHLLYMHYCKMSSDCPLGNIFLLHPPFIYFCCHSDVPCLPLTIILRKQTSQH